MDFTPSQRYPDPAVEVLDEAFLKLRLYSSHVERLATGLRWAEGPVWFGDGRYLLFSDVPGNAIHRWDECSGATSVFRSPSHHANGHARDRLGRLVSCEHLTRRVTRTEYDGTITVLCDRIEGKRLNSPNDVVVASDGAIYFTDPPFGIHGNYEGHRAEPELREAVYRIDPRTRQTTVVADDVIGPNGLCFSPDEKQLYIVESRGVPTRKIKVYDVADDGRRLTNGRVHIDCGPGTSDGMRCDEQGNLWCGWGMGDPALDGVMVFAPDATPIGRIALPERCANVCFGGRARSRLFMAACQSIYALYVNVAGAKGG